MISPRNGESPLFSPVKLGNLSISNRFMRSSTSENLNDSKGAPTERLISMISNLSRCEIGLIVPGSVECDTILNGASGKLIYREITSGWERCIKNVHENKSKIIFQICHSNAPDGCDSSEVKKMVQKYVETAKVLREMGADGIQLSLADGMPLYKFIMPELKLRNGKCIKSKFGIICELIQQIRSEIDIFPISVKIDTNDYRGNKWMEPKLASKYIGLIKKDVDFFEISSGNCIGNFSRSRYNEEALCRNSMSKKQSLIDSWRREFDGKKEFTENYNLSNFQLIKKDHPDVKFALVGGIRKFSTMENLVKNKGVDVISMSRPFINDPYFIQRLKIKTLDESLCINCGSCLINRDNGVFCNAR